MARTSGVLLHITSLPSRFGIGDLGPSAYQFVDFLTYTKQSVWQVLPLVPPGYGYSPYAGLSTFAGNVMLISPDRLKDDGLLVEDDWSDLPQFKIDHVDFEPVQAYKFGLLAKAYERFKAGEGTISAADFDAFCEKESWLDDYAVFMTLKHAHDGVMWTEWDPALAARDPEAMAAARETHAEGIAMQKFWQFLFSRQWDALHAHCKAKGISIFGDLPIYVAHDSADVWANRDLFYLQDDGNPIVVSGVPPDYFSETGQRWGNPIYRWDVMKANGYDWWIRRFAKVLEQVDLVRLDHFRGFEAFWEVPAEEDTAINGRWVDGPGADLFSQLEEALGKLPVIAENLGVITQGVTDLMEQFDFPGMAILQFAFDSDPSNEFLPHNYQQNLVAYTGTHDNDTVVGWWTNTASTQDAAAIERAHAYCRDYLHLEREPAMHWAFIRALMASVADMVVFPVQDLLGLGAAARMNTPGEGSGNWAWRLQSYQIGDDVAAGLRHLTQTFGRMSS